MASPPSSSHQPRTGRAAASTPEEPFSAAASGGARQAPLQDGTAPMETQDAKPSLLDTFKDEDLPDFIEKQKKFEAIYARRLKAKYFSRMTFNGGDIFDQETTIDDEVIKTGRWPCTRSFADSVQSLGDRSRSPSLVAETSAGSNKKARKSC